MCEYDLERIEMTETNNSNAEENGGKLRCLISLSVSPFCFFKGNGMNLLYTGGGKKSCFN